LANQDAYILCQTCEIFENLHKMEIKSDFSNSKWRQIHKEFGTDISLATNSKWDGTGARENYFCDLSLAKLEHIPEHNICFLRVIKNLVNLTDGTDTWSQNRSVQ